MKKQRHYDTLNEELLNYWLPNYHWRKQNWRLNCSPSSFYYFFSYPTLMT